MIRHDFRIRIEKAAANAKNVDSGEKDEREADTEENPEGENGILMRVDDREHRIRPERHLAHLPEAARPAVTRHMSITGG